MPTKSKSGTLLLLANRSLSSSWRRSRDDAGSGNVRRSVSAGVDAADFATAAAAAARSTATAMNQAAAAGFIDEPQMQSGGEAMGRRWEQLLL